ncbi:MAG: ribosomal-processing cysteine protease Prp [Synergistaceae bacterium]|jgi:uncharacterized protein YsxB (DUF464 family)|nr:ribosomal-processing cysteine protease Prp [Synergistaceae bacterium]
MIEVAVKRSASGGFSITATGHSGYADPGSDIVCAAVSTLVQALHAGLADVIRVKGVRLVQNKRRPAMRLKWRGGGESALHLAQTVFLSMKAVEASYPRFVKVTGSF